MGALMEVSMCSRPESYAVKSPPLGCRIVKTKRAFSTVRWPAGYRGNSALAGESCSA